MKKTKNVRICLAAIMIASLLVFALVSCGGGDDDVKQSASAATPTITQQPQGNAYFPGVTATPLTVTASVSDGGTLSYQWYSSNNALGGTAIEGATTASYTPPTATAGTVYYRVRITNTINDKTAIKESDYVDVVTGFKEAKNLINPVHSVAFSGDRFVVGYGFGKTAWSSDGINWTEVDATSVFGTSYVNVAYVKDRFIAKSYTVIATSTNGESWTKVTNPFGDTKYTGAIAYGNNHFYSFGGGIKWTDDFTTWTEVTPTGTNTAVTFGFTTVNLGPAAYGNSKFLVIGYNGAEVGVDPTDQKLASFNGTSWDGAASTITVTSGVIKPSDIIYANNNFIVESNDYKKLVKSANGTSWTEITPPANIMETGLSGIGYGSDKLFAFLFGKWAYSDDNGDTWTEVIESKSYNQIAYGNGVFVAVGDNSVYYTNHP